MSAPFILAADPTVPEPMHVLKSTLLHTALAYSSPEMATMDYVIRNAHRQLAPGRPVLPTEVLLLVRESLLPQVAAQLIKRSTHALVAYERSLRALLCSDCISYNHDIFGPDVWQWDQFNGACACVESAESITLLFGSRNATGCVKQPPRTQQPRAGIPHPKQYTDSSHWLESYLSREASLLVTPGPSEAGSVRAAPDIWTLVSTMLRDYDCEALWDPEEAARARSHNRIVRRQFHFLRDTIQVSALRHEATRGPETASLEPEDRQRTQIILVRGVRELGLALAYAEEYSAYVPYVLPVMHLRWPGASNACYRGQELVDLAKELAQTVLSLALGCLSVPITFAAIAVRIFCYYSRPRGFRLL